MTFADFPDLIPAISTCLYCMAGQHIACVPNQHDQWGRIKVVCGCYADDITGHLHNVL